MTAQAQAEANRPLAVRWGVVAQVAPQRVTVDGDTVPLDVDRTVAPGAAVGTVVLVAVQGAARSVIAARRTPSTVAALTPGSTSQMVNMVDHGYDVSAFDAADWQIALYVEDVAAPRINTLAGRVDALESTVVALRAALVAAGIVA